jgi:probable phosphoglycerate mutase
MSATTTTFLLIRHASHDLLGRVLTGRKVDVALNATGRDEASELGRRLSGVAIDALLVSPRERARATAEPIAASLDLVPRVLHDIDEVDVGAWGGAAFPDLEHDAEWKTWCERRSTARPPNGESIQAVQNRIVRAMTDIAVTHPGKTVAMISHGDVIKAALSHYLGLSLDHLERFAIGPASVSVVVCGDGWSQVKLVNDSGHYAWS